MGIVKGDGDTKNDCERNAAKRLLSDLRREHPHLKLLYIYIPNRQTLFLRFLRIIPLIWKRAKAVIRPLAQQQRYPERYANTRCNPCHNQKYNGHQLPDLQN
jgi:hypothetical protein